MTRFFTHNWSNATCRQEREVAGLLEHTAGNQFLRRGVRPGDFVYVVNVSSGRMRVIGRMKVARIVGRRKARGKGLSHVCSY